MIFRVTKDQIPRIIRLILSLEKLFGSKNLYNHINDSNQIIYVDTKKLLSCRLVVDEETQEVHVAWLIPAWYNKHDLGVLFMECVWDAYNEFPYARGWNVTAKFKTGKGCLAFTKKLGIDKRMALEWQKCSPNTVSVYQSEDGWWNLTSKLDELVFNMRNFNDSTNFITNKIKYGYPQIYL